MTFERMAEGVVHVPAGGTGPDRADGERGATAGDGPAGPGTLPAAARLQILATEHWSLLASRSMAYTESFSRAGMFLSVLSGAVVALALVAQATSFKEGFDLFAIVLLPVVLFVGIATFVRLVQVNNEDVHWVYGMNRLRHAYLEADPTLAPYFMTAWHDDEVGMLMSLGARPGGSVLLHGLITTPGMLGVVNSVLAGVLAGFVAVRLNAETWVVIAAGVLAFIVLLAVQLTFQQRTVMAMRRAYVPHFPHAADPPILQTDG